MDNDGAAASEQVIITVTATGGSSEGQTSGDQTSGEQTSGTQTSGTQTSDESQENEDISLVNWMSGGGGKSSGGGCTVNPSAKFDPTFLIVILSMMFKIYRRRKGFKKVL